MEFLANGVQENELKSMLIAMRGIINPAICDSLQKSTTEADIAGLAIDFALMAFDTGHTEAKVNWGASNNGISIDNDGDMATWPYRTKIFVTPDELVGYQLRVITDDTAPTPPVIPIGWECISKP